MNLLFTVLVIGGGMIWSFVRIIKARNGWEILGSLALPLSLLCSVAIDNLTLWLISVISIILAGTGADLHGGSIERKKEIRARNLAYIDKLKEKYRAKEK